MKYLLAGLRVLSVCLLMQSIAQAQYFTASGRVSALGTYAQGIPVCQVGPLANVPAGCSFSGVLDPNHGGANLVASANAWADANGLHAYSSVLTSVSPFDPATYSAEARAIVQEQGVIIATGIHPTYADLTLELTTDGLVSGGSSFGYSQIDTTFLGGVGECYFYNAGTCTVHGLVNLNLAMNVSMLLEAIANTSLGLGVADFSDTLFLSELSFTDLAGNPLDVSFITNLPYRPDTSVIEPGSLALIGIGLAGLGFSRRKQ